MLESDVVSVTDGLVEKNFPKVLVGLRRIGLPIKRAWGKKTPESYKFSSDPRFKEFLVTQLQTYIDKAKSDQLPNIQELKKKLTRLSLFIRVWNDRAAKDNLNSSEESAEKKLHQEIKFKAPLDKDDRYAINIALQSMVFILCQQSERSKNSNTDLTDFTNQFKEVKNIENSNTDLTDFTNQFKEVKSKEALLEFISKRISRLNNLKSDSNYQDSSDIQQEIEKKRISRLNNLKQEIEKMGAAISAFQTPNIKKKIIKYAGKIVALLASIACGLTTGGAIYLLGPSLLALAISLGIFTILVALTFNRRFTGIAISLVCGLAMGVTVYSLGLLLTPGLALLFSAITLGLLTGVFGFTANFGFFSKNFPGFLLSLVKKAGISEFIDNNGNRKQFSANYKYLLIPLITFSSLTVGAGTVALTYITILSLFTKLATLLPILTLVWPPLPLIIAGVLAAAVGIALTVAVLTASLDILKKVAALNLGFVPLCKYAYESCKNWVADLRNLKTRDIIGLVILLLLLPVGLAGLAYFRYTAGVDLSAFIGVTGAIVMGVVAYIAQMAFICLSVNKLKNAIINPSASSNDFSALTVNAAGNGVLVYDGSPLSLAGMISCFLNSFCGNMSETDLNKEFRTKQTATIVQEVKNFNTKVKTEPSESTSLNLDNTQPLKKQALNGLPLDNTQLLVEPVIDPPSRPMTNCAYSVVRGQTTTFFSISSKGSNNLIDSFEANSRPAPS